MMKYITILSVLVLAPFSLGVPVDTTTVEVASVAGMDKVPTCDSDELWDFCLQSDDDDLIWCNGEGVLQFKNEDIQAKCDGGCQCTITGMGGFRG